MFDVGGKYRFIEEFARGGFASVYLAERDGKNYAIKVLDSCSEVDFMDCYFHEITMNARLRHPQIVPIVDYWYEDRAAYLVMPYISGGNLAQKLTKNGAISLLAAAHILKQIADTLYFMHQHKISHQDIKPENIVFDNQGNAYLIDFGVARDLSNPATSGHAKNLRFLGSPHYIAPEQLRRESITHHSDIYSLGLLAYTILTACPPYWSRRIEVLFQQQLYEPVPRLHGSLPAALNYPIRLATHKNPAERYTNVLDFSRDFLEIALQHA